MAYNIQVEVILTVQKGSMMVNGCYYDGNARFLLSSRTAKMMHDFGHHQRGERAAVWIVAQSIEGTAQMGVTAYP